MSKIKLPHASGNSMSIGAPATNPASDLELKLPATVGTAGQVLMNSGTAGTLEFGYASVEADDWRLNTTFSSSESFITTNWERNDTYFDKIGTGMSESSGVFTFPTTGIWRIDFNVSGNISDTNVRYAGGHIYITHDNSTYREHTQNYSNIVNHGSAYTSTHTSVLFDVADTSTHKVKFLVKSAVSISWHGSTSHHNTWALFTRLGDT